jgi:putative transcriptional regulator
MSATTPGYDVRVREIREGLGLSQEALARQCGVSRQAIVNIERGESQPRVLLAIAIGTALGVAIGEIFKKVPTP